MWRKRQLLQAYRRFVACDGGIELNTFLATCASEKGWDVQWMLDVICEHEELQTKRNATPPLGNLTYSPGSITTPEMPNNQTFSAATVGDVAAVDLARIAATKTHVCLVGNTRVGKSTTYKALILEVLKIKPSAQFIIVDGKTTDWFGLQQLGGTVKYLSGSAEDQIEAAELQIDKAFSALQDRKQEQQRKLLSGESSSFANYHECYLIISEWFALYDSIIKNPKIKNSIIQKINELLVKGAELKVHVLFDTHSHLVTECGLSKTIQKCLNWIVLGRNHPDVGYGCVLEALNGRSPLFSDNATRQRLNAQLGTAVQRGGDFRLALVASGNPYIGLVPDLAWVHDQKLQLPPGSCTGSAATAETPAPSALRHTSDFRDAPTSTSNAGYKPLFLALVALQHEGWSDTRLIEEILGYRGRRFAEGQRALSALRAMGRHEGWQ